MQETNHSHNLLQSTYHGCQSALRAAATISHKIENPRISSDLRDIQLELQTLSHRIAMELSGCEDYSGGSGGTEGDWIWPQIETLTNASGNQIANIILTESARGIDSVRNSVIENKYAGGNSVVLANEFISLQERQIEIMTQYKD